tara:strand:- start:159 stop:590 length:432 start_codon:yes stop_codon:yes gene_type:complete
MVRYLYETVCPHGYVKNGYDKTKLVEYMKNIQVKHMDSKSFNLDHICKDKKEFKSILFIDAGKITRETDDTLIFEVIIDEDCRLENISGNTLYVLDDYFRSIHNNQLQFSVKNPKNIKLSKMDTKIYKHFEKWMTEKSNTKLF